MQLQVSCPHCRTTRLVGDQMAGQLIHCAACGGSFMVAPLAPPSAPPVRWKPAVICIVIVVAFILGGWYFITPSRMRARNGPSAGGAGAVPITTTFGPRPPAQIVGDQIEFYDIAVDGDGPARPMRLNLYLPLGRRQPKSLPCVVIAPAGSACHGMKIDQSDRVEHYPYVRAGFAVIAYELSGAMADPKKQQLTYRELIGPVKEFMAADGGLLNGQTAIDYVLQRVPEVAPNQIFACGHSSAATVALNLAAADSRIRACCAYAPATDVEAWWDDPGMERFIPGFRAFAARKSPLRHVDSFQCPVYLFHADDDSLVKLADNQAFANAMRDAGKRITFDRVASGGHYDSMLSEGIPRGIKFMISQGATPLPPAQSPH